MEDKKNAYNDLIGEYERISEQRERIEKAHKNFLENTDAGKRYQSLGEEKATEYPDAYNQEQELKELQEKQDTHKKDLTKIATGLVKEMAEQKKSVEEELAALEAKIEEKENHFKEKEAELVDVKASEEYKVGDPAAIKKAKSLQMQINVNRNWIKKKRNEIDNSKKKIEDLTNEINALKTKWNIKDIEVVTQENQENAETQQVVQQQNQAKTNTTNENQQVVQTQKGNSQATEVNNQNVPQTSEGTETQKSENTGLSKEEFNALYERAKRGKLIDGDYEKIAAILSDKESYKNYGITTGVIFNKGKVLLKALGKEFKMANVIDYVNMYSLDINLDDKGIIRARELYKWGKLSKILKNPNQIISAEDILKRSVKIVDDKAKNRDARITEAEVDLYKNAKEELKKYEALRSAIAMYGDVANERKPERFKDVKKLTAAPIETQKQSNYQSVVNLEELGKEQSENKEPVKTEVKEKSNYVSVVDLESLVQPPSEQDFKNKNYISVNDINKNKKDKERE